MSDPQRITSMVEFIDIFGGAQENMIEIDIENDSGTDAVADDLLSLLRGSPALKMDLKMGVALSDIADMMLSCGKWEEALEHSNKAKKYFEEESYNFLVVEDIEIRALLLSGANGKALKIVDKLMDKENEHISPLIQCKYDYYKACALFLDGQNGESIQILSGLNELKKDKYCWNVVIRILLILNFIEQGNYDVADNEIDSFRKYMNRVAKRKEVSPRYGAVADMLLSLRNNCWDFEKNCSDAPRFHA